MIRSFIMLTVFFGVTDTPYAKGLAHHWQLPDGTRTTKLGATKHLIINSKDSVYKCTEYKLSETKLTLKVVKE
jgi:hypothetical protein